MKSEILRSAAIPTGWPDTIPAPTGGWNARDPVANMPGTDALFLDNWFPTAGTVDLRKGSTLFATLPEDVEPSNPHNVRALLTYSSPTGAKKLFAGMEDGLYDVTAGGAISALSSSASDSAWISVNISTAGGNFLWACNGVNTARVFDGAAWTLLNTISAPALTGVVSVDIAHVGLFKTRLIFCCKNSLSFWYLPVNSIAGAALEFPLGALFSKGGYLVATGSWTLDGGNGPEDYFVAITSEGEVAVYSGTDPSDATAWGLVGVYYIGTPLGRTCLCKLGGDLAIMTVQGLYPLSKTLLLTAADKRVAISDKISKAWITYTNLYSDNYGWQPVLFPQGPFLLVNVPIRSNHLVKYGTVSYQFVMNTQTRAWCRFVGQSAEAWVVHDNELYYALHNKVYKAFTDSANGTDNGAAIQGRAKTAFFYPSGRGRNSYVNLAQPVLTGSGEINLQFGIDVDYNEAFLSGGSSYSYASTLSLWDSAVWDESVWASGNLVQAPWKSVNHMPGKAISLRLRVNSRGVTISWTATNLILQKGGMM